MSTKVIKAGHFHVNMAGTAFLVYGDRYRNAALSLITAPRTEEGFDPVSYYLFCLSLELYLKSFIWLHEQSITKRIKSKYGHDLEKLWRHAKTRGINKYAQPTALRNHVIAVVGPYYRDRKLNYLDIDMIVNGFKTIKSEPKTLPTLNRLTDRLSKTLRSPVLKAS